MVCWYAVSGAAEPGLWGWGIIISYAPEDDEIRWRPTFPSDLLKMAPMYDDQLNACVKHIRGRMAQGTMWLVEPDDAEVLTERIVGAVRPSVG